MEKRLNVEERGDVFARLTTRIKRLSEQSDLTDLLNYVLHFLTEELEADRGVVFLYDEHRNMLRIKSTAGVDDATLEDASTISQTIVSQVAGSKESVVSADAVRDLRFKDSHSVKLNCIRSLLCVPITIGDRLLGVVYLDSVSKDSLFRDKDLTLTEVFIQNAAYEIDFRHRQSETPYVSVTAPSDMSYGYDSLVGSSKDIIDLKSKIEKGSAHHVNVLIVGESGTGKELVAKMIHYNGFNADKPFIGINCASLPETLLESELFGIEKGTATGVDKRIGRFEQAGEGTIFLDEVGAMDLNTQAKFLRVLQERQFERLGNRSRNPLRLKARIISATNADLGTLMEAGKFREDLFFRLNVYLVEVPPLRNHKDDIPALCKRFIKKYGNVAKAETRELSEETLDVLYNYDWPGNARELENCVQYALVNSRGPVIGPESLPPNVLDTALKKAPETLTDAVTHFEREIIVSTLRNSKWVKAKAALKLGISETTLRHKVKKYGIGDEDRLPAT